MGALGRGSYEPLYADPFLASPIGVFKEDSAQIRLMRPDGSYFIYIYKVVVFLTVINIFM